MRCSWKNTSYSSISDQYKIPLPLKQVLVLTRLMTFLLFINDAATERLLEMGGPDLKWVFRTWNGWSGLANLGRLNALRLDRFFMTNSGKCAKIVRFNLLRKDSTNTISNAFQIHVYVCLRNSWRIQHIFDSHHCCHYVKHILLICTSNQ